MDHSPIAHDPIVPGSTITWEYRFPVKAEDLKVEHRKNISPWFARFLNKSPKDIHSLLCNDWCSLDGSVKKISTFLESGLPSALVFHSSSIWLAIEHSLPSWKVSMLSEPKELNAGEMEFIRKFRSEGLEKLFIHFREVYNEITPFYHCLKFEPKAQTDTDFFMLGEWNEGIHIFSCGTGSEFFLNQEGIVGKWSVEMAYPGSDRAIEPVFNSISSFIENYLEFRTSENLGEDSILFS